LPILLSAEFSIKDGIAKIEASRIQSLLVVHLFFCLSGH
jgi:hypothetical protein